MKRYKYPRTYHFPFSEGIGSDDKVFNDYEQYFKGKDIVITEKMDGENTTIYKDFCHTRSIDSKHRDYHSWLLSYIKSFQYRLDDDERICGEYLYAVHSIKYDSLPSYFTAFSVWHGDKCLSWKDTEKRCRELNIITVPVLYRGVYDIDKIKSFINVIKVKNREGIVMRLASEFDYNDFSKSIIKFVRKDHVTTDKHWSQGKIEKNGLI